MTLRDDPDTPEVPGNETPPDFPGDDDAGWPATDVDEPPLRMPGDNPDVETEL